MAHVIQVGVGSGGMPVLDILCREEVISRVTLIEPDVYKDHNVVRHLFPTGAVGRPKAELAEKWLKSFRPDLEIRIIQGNLLDPSLQQDLEDVIQSADIGVCAVDNEPAKFHWDRLMRKHQKPWTLGEVLSGGIGGFVHWFVPGGPCYGCVASHLKRVQVDNPPRPDYSAPGGPVHEVTVPATRGSIANIASLHALITLELLASPTAFNPGFTSLLWTLKKVPDIFEEAFRPYRFRIPRLGDCLICREGPDLAKASPEELDVALDQALARLGDE